MAGRAWGHMLRQDPPRMRGTEKLSGRGPSPPLAPIASILRGREVNAISHMFKAARDLQPHDSEGLLAPFVWVLHPNKNCGGGTTHERMCSGWFFE